MLQCSIERHCTGFSLIFVAVQQFFCNSYEQGRDLAAKGLLHYSAIWGASGALQGQTGRYNRRMSTSSLTAKLQLHDLGRAMRQERARLAERDRLREQAAQEQARRQREPSDGALFALAMRGVVQLKNSQSYPILERPRPAPVPTQTRQDGQRVMVEALSDAFDVSTLLETDAAMSFRRLGVGPDVTRRLRAGRWAIQAQLDLHGLRSDAARERLGAFIRKAHNAGLRCVRVIHGKGLGSPGGQPVLKDKVQRWLVQKSEVLAFVQARAQDGGAGAVVVLLQPVRWG